MPDPYIGEIILFGGNFAPKGWALCDGQLLPISQNQALFSILGTTYGGDGRTTFALPDLRGRVSVHPGTGPGLTPRNLGERGGTETVTLRTEEMPSHNHGAGCHPDAGDAKDPVNNFPAATEAEADYNSSGDKAMNPDFIRHTGGGQPHANMQPFLGVNYIIALVGVFPSRS